MSTNLRNVGLDRGYGPNIWRRRTQSGSAFPDARFTVASTHH